MSADLSTHEVLVKARELIADPERWTRFVYARDVKGHPAGETEAEREDGGNPLSPDAVCWCASGAISKIAGTQRQTDADHALAEVVREMGVAQLGKGSIPSLNDGIADGSHPTPEKGPRYAPARHRKVLAAFDKAIAATEPKA